jgi:hypothetical protein
MKTQDTWFLLLISAIWTELRLVGEICTFEEVDFGWEKTGPLRHCLMSFIENYPFVNGKVRIIG